MNAIWRLIAQRLFRNQALTVIGAVTPDVARAHRHSARHRDEVLGSEQCGCFYCGAIFSPVEIVVWTDEWEGTGQTAVCPQCGVDSVIGSASGYTVTPEFLTAMKCRWF